MVFCRLNIAERKSEVLCLLGRIKIEITDGEKNSYLLAFSPFGLRFVPNNFLMAGLGIL